MAPRPLKLRKSSSDIDSLKESLHRDSLPSPIGTVTSRLLGRFWRRSSSMSLESQEDVKFDTRSLPGRSLYNEAILESKEPEEPAALAALPVMVGESTEWAEFASLFTGREEPPNWEQLTSLFTKLGASVDTRDPPNGVQVGEASSNPTFLIGSGGGWEDATQPSTPASLGPDDVWSIVSFEMGRRSLRSNRWSLPGSLSGRTPVPSRLPPSGTGTASSRWTAASRGGTAHSSWGTMSSRAGTSSSKRETWSSFRTGPASPSSNPWTSDDQLLTPHALPNVPELPLSTEDSVAASEHLKDITIDPTDVVVSHQVSFGGSCDLFIGYSATHGRVALKRPRVSEDSVAPDMQRRFEREAAIWKFASNAHINILPFYGLVKKDDAFYLVSPWIEGHDLRTSLERGGKIDKVKVLTGVASALVLLHSKSIIHGDINAKNILLDNNHMPLLCDFGLAKIVSDGMATSINMKGVGTLRWMAPELLQDSPKTMATDVYAFGMTIVEVLTGKPPYPNVQDSGRLIYCIISGVGRPSKPSSGSSSGPFDLLWSIVDRCCVRDAAQRPTMAEIYSELSVSLVACH